MILDEIVASKRQEVALLRERTPEMALRAAALAAPAARDFAGALRAPDGTVRLIAEVKRKSPSKGVFRAGLDAAELARTYAAHGAACLSVLTDGPFFQGSLDDLRAVRQAVALPLLRKEFIIDAAQIYEARAAGADAVLLIAAILDDALLAAFHGLAGALGMGALVEVHDEAELRRVLPLRPALIGINNRDLQTFRTDLATTERLRPLIPAGTTESRVLVGSGPHSRNTAVRTTGGHLAEGSGPQMVTSADHGTAVGTTGSRVRTECVVVGESGIHTRADVERLRRAGVQAILVGESLIMAADTAAQMHELLDAEG